MVVVVLVASLFGDAGGAGGVGVCNIRGWNLFCHAAGGAGVCNIRGWNLFCHACEAFEEDREYPYGSIFGILRVPTAPFLESLGILGYLSCPFRNPSGFLWFPFWNL